MSAQWPIRRVRPFFSLIAIMVFSRLAVRFWDKHVPLFIAVRRYTASEPAAGPVVTGSKFRLLTSAVCKKKDGSRAKYGQCGEDSYMISSGEGFASPHKSILAVADGVGGWAEHGGDSSQVSNGFMVAMKELHKVALKNEEESKWFGLPMLIRNSFEHLIGLRRLSKGTTTICAAAFDHEKGVLEVCNIGDSQLVVVREGKVILEVEAGVWAFNSPNQVGFGLYGEPQGDVEEMSIEKRLKLQPGDIVVIGSDGLFDNVFVEEIGRIVWEHAGKQRSEASTQKAAQALLDLAYKRGLDDNFFSPFAKEAIAARKAPPNYRGGKPDDISIIVSMVQ